MTSTTPQHKNEKVKKNSSKSVLSVAVFGHDAAMRVNIQRSFLSFSIYLIWMIVEAICAANGLISWTDAGLMYGFNLLGVSVFYALMRSGFSTRLADPSMVLAQSIYAAAALMIAYGLIPETRAAVLQTLCIIVVFGMFTLRPREIVIACAWMVSMPLATVTLMFWLHPPRFDAQQEIINVSIACIVLPGLTSIARHFALLRERLRVQRAEIKAALGRAQELATHDSLTNLTNRAHMQEILNQEIARYQRYGSAFSLALLDLDHFKSINDTHGHLVGDEVLVGFARQAEANQRKTDVIARWGGEEFLVLMPQTPSNGALLVAERLRESIANARLSSTVEGLTVTISAGVAQIEANESLLQALERADRALYAAKKAGRNKVVLSQ